MFEIVDIKIDKNRENPNETTKIYFGFSRHSFGFDNSFIGKFKQSLKQLIPEVLEFAKISHTDSVKWNNKQNFFEVLGDFGKEIFVDIQLKSTRKKNEM